MTSTLGWWGSQVYLQKICILYGNPYQKGGGSVRCILRPMSMLLLICVVFCYVGTDMAFAHQAVIAAAQKDKGSETDGLIGSLLIIGAIWLGIRWNNRREHEKWLNSVDEYFAENPHREENKELVLNKQVAIGMNKSEATLAWGKPSSVNRTTNIWGSNEQWVYRRGDYNASYIYFDNNVLTTIQN